MLPSLFHRPPHPPTSTSSRGWAGSPPQEACGSALGILPRPATAKRFRRPLLCAWLVLLGAAWEAHGQAGTPTLSIGRLRVEEGESGTSTARIPVHLSAPAATPISVSWSTADETATSGTDYTAATGTLQFQPGDSVRTVPIVIHGDTLDEEDESFTVRLSHAVGATLGQDTGRVLVVADEPVTAVSLPPDAVAFENIANPTPPAALIGNPTATRLARGIIVSGTATQGVDLTMDPASGDLDLSKSPSPLPVRVHDDAVDETDESYVFRVSEPGPGVRLLPGSPEQTVMASSAVTRLAVDHDILAALEGADLRIWRRDTSGWVEDAVISGAAEGGVTALALDQGLLAADFAATGVKLFERIAGTWTAVAVLPRPSAEPDTGRTLALQDDTLAIGGAWRTPEGKPSGRVWIHERHAGGTNAWGLKTTVDPTRILPTFGSSLALWGDRLAVGTSDAFSVTLFERSADSRQWTQIGEIVRFIPGFGRSVALDSSLLVVPGLRQLVMLARSPETGTWTEQTMAFMPATIAGQPVMMRRGVICAVASMAVHFLSRPPSAGWSLPGPPAIGAVLSVSKPLIAYDGHTLVRGDVPADTGVPLIIQGPPSVAGTIIDNETLRFTLDDVVTDSPNAPDVFLSTLRLSRPLALPVSVTVTSHPGTAVPDSDYVPFSIVYTFAPGQTTQVIGLRVFPPDASEDHESFYLRLSEPSVGTIGPDATVLIVPPPPNIDFTEETIVLAEGNAGTTSVPIPLQLTGPAPAGASYQWRVTSNESLVVASSGVVAVPAGATTSQFEILVKGDTVPGISAWLSIEIVERVKLGRIDGLTTKWVSVLNDDSGIPADDSYAIAQGQVLTGVNVAANDTGMGRTVLHLNSSRGGVNLWPSGDLTYTSLPNFIGTDSFQYRDQYDIPNVPPRVGTVVIEVGDARVPPVLQPDGDFTMLEEKVLDYSQPTSPSLFRNDGLLDGSGIAYDPILEVRAVEVKHGAVTDMQGLDGRFKFTPDPDFAGFASFSYQVRDKDGWSAPAAVRIQVRDDLPLGPLQRVGAPGSQLFAATSTPVAIPGTGTIDHQLALRAGQTVSVLVPITSGAPVGKLEVLDATGTALTGGIRSANSLQHLPIPADGTYKLVIGDRSLNQGTFRISVVVNGGAPGQPTNPASPYPLDTALVEEGLRAAVFTSTGLSSSAPHHYAFSGASGETVRVHLHSNPAQTFTLQNAAGEVLARSAVNPNDPLAASLQHTLPAAGSYRVVVQGRSSTTYSLELYPDARTHQALPERPPPVTRAATGSLEGAGVASPAQPGTTFSFAAFADYGSGSPDQAAVATMVKSWQPDFLVAAGDHNYSLGYAVGEASWNRNVGAFYGEFIKRRLDNRYPDQTSPTQRFFPVPGNHDSGPDSTNGGELSSYLDYFHSNPGGEPRLPDGVHLPRLSYYKMSWGPADFFFLDSDNAMVSTATRDTQRQWLREQIAASGARWKFGVWHHPPYSSGGNHGNHPLLQWGADLAGLTALITGHDHIYERLDMGHGVTQFITGLGGASIYQFADRPVPQSLVRYNASRGALRGMVGPDGVRFEFWAVSSAGSLLIDSMTVGIPPGIPLASGTDTWSLPVRRGQTVQLSTRTPLPPGELAHDVNPALALVDADGRIVATATGGAADGRNAVLRHTVPGVPASPDEVLNWSVRVLNEAAGSGEYELLVSSPASDPFAEWMAGRVPADQDGPDQDPDGDGWPNLLEYLRDSDPSVAASPATPPLETTSAEPLTLRLHLPASWDRPVTARLEATPSLSDGSWTTLATKSANGPWTSETQTVPVAHPEGGFTFVVASLLPAYYRLVLSLE